MKRSTDRILTTHVGSLPRPDDVCAMLIAKEKGEKIDAAAFDALVSKAVQAVVRRQVEAGVDIVCDGEMAKPGYATYIKDRLTGFSGDSPRRPPADLALYPAYLKKIHAAGETPSIIRQRCTGPVAVRDRKPLADDLARLDAALKSAKPAAGGFMTAASPGVIANFQPNEFYPSHEKYLEALAEAMREEYEAITRAGYVLQVDCPDLAMGRHIMFAQETDEGFLKFAAQNVEALNHALANVPAEQVRMHLCWGNYEGPHVCDIPLAQDPRHGAQGEAAGDLVRGGQSPSRPRVGGVQGDAHSGGQDPAAGRDRLGLEFRRASRVRRRAHRPLRRHRRPRARDREQRLRLRHLRRLRQGRFRHHLRQAEDPGGRGGDREPAAMGLMALA